VAAPVAGLLVCKGLPASQACHISAYTRCSLTKVKQQFEIGYGGGNATEPPDYVTLRRGRLQFSLACMSAEDLALILSTEKERSWLKQQRF
jgi:hypothetical protein